MFGEDRATEEAVSNLRHGQQCVEEESQEESSSLDEQTRRGRGGVVEERTGDLKAESAINSNTSRDTA